MADTTAYALLRRAGLGPLRFSLVVIVAGCVFGCGKDEFLQACAIGADGCRCYANETCDQGLSCRRGSCHGPSDSMESGGAGTTGSGPGLRPADATISIESSLVRGCDLVLAGAGDHDVSFAPGVRGSSFAKGDDTGVAFIADKDAPFFGSPVLLSPKADAGASNATVASVTCYDRLGQSVADPRLSLASK
jgi:hypothetical protein